MRAGAAKPGKTFADSIWDTGFLLYGKGESEAMLSYLGKILSRDVKTPVILDDFGLILETIDPG